MQVTFLRFSFFDLWQVTGSISQAQHKAKVTSPTLVVSIQEMTANEETKSNTKREDSNQVCTKILKRKKILPKLLPKIKRVKAPRQNPIHYSHWFLLIWEQSALDCSSNIPKPWRIPANGRCHLRAFSYSKLGLSYPNCSQKVKRIVWLFPLTISFTH